MGMPAEQPDNAAQPQPRPWLLPEIVSPTRPRTRARARTGGGGGIQPPLLVSTHLLQDPPPSPAPDSAKRREEARALLAGVGVRKAYVLARDYPAEHIEGWVAAWRADRDGGADIGPGALAVRIEQWGPPPETSVLAAMVREDTEADWLERRYKRGKGGSLR